MPLLKRRKPVEEPTPELPPAREAERVLTRLDWHVVRRLDGILQGDYRSLFHGHGLDLAEVREYQPEDDVRYMDWNVTARTGHPHVRRYHEDREITAWLLLDLSGSVDFGTARAQKRDLVLDFAGALARLLTRRGNRVGAILYSGGVDEVLPARGGRQQALAIIHRLLRPGRKRSGGQTDLGAVLDRAAQTVRQRSLMFVVSDFIAPEGWERALRRLATRHELIAVWLIDPREEDLPDVGPLILEDAETGEQMYVDTHDRGFRERFRARAAERRGRLARTFARLAIDVLPLSTESDVVDEVARFALRRKQARGRTAGALLPSPPNHPHPPAPSPTGGEGESRRPVPALSGD